MRSMPDAARSFDWSRLEATVAGLVQGVNFRWFTQRVASSLGLVGYVRNQGDGSVRVVAEGDRRDLEELLSQIRVGPSAAVVDEVDFHWTAPRHEFERFQIRY